MPQETPGTESKLTGIKVVGIGGAGCSAVNRMIAESLRGVEYISINTDPQALFLYDNPSKKILIGQTITKGMGAGGNAEIGFKAIEENKSEVQEAIAGADLVFITAGMGGGTGTGAAPVVAEMAKSLGALTIAVVTTPFTFEGELRRSVAERGIAELSGKVDTLITIPNDNLLNIVEKKTPLTEAFKMADKILKEGVHGITDIMMKPGLVNVDFADINTIMKDSGSALMGIGISSGDQKAVSAATDAINNPLQNARIDGAKGVLFCITGSPSMTLNEVNEAANYISKAVAKDAKIIFGVVIDERYQDKVSVTVIATGFGNKEENSDFSDDTLDSGYSGFSAYSSYQQTDSDTDSFSDRFYKKQGK
ncbi:MAG: cell division protein FtsZ [bacterium]|nr:cell division protein FtsZ [bacterium]